MLVTLQVPVQGAADDGWDQLKLPAEGFGDGPRWHRVLVHEEARDVPLRLAAAPGGDARFLLTDDVWDPAHLAAFSTAVQVVEMFEADDVLATPVQWREQRPALELWFEGSRGSPAYNPATGRLNLPWRQSDDGAIVHSGRSRDIVAHETGHAVLDSLAPDLADAVTPESLAMHEAIADLVAFISSLQSPTLRRRVIRRARDHEKSPEQILAVFAQIAESYAQEVRGHSWLRSLSNQRGFPGCDAPMQPLTAAEQTLPHPLGEVLGGALFDLAPELFELSRQSKGWALYRLADHFKRVVLRALTYLPPGELTFTDLVRVVLAADVAIHPGNFGGIVQQAILGSLKRRGVLLGAAPEPWSGVRTSLPEDPAELVAKLLSKGSRLREELEPIPAVVEVTVQEVAKRVTQPLPWRDGTRERKTYQTVRIPERVVKLRWVESEDGPDGVRALPVGATVVVDEKGWVRLAVRGRPEGQEVQRDAWIARANELGLIGNDPTYPIERQQNADGTISYRGMSRYLHLHAGGPEHAP